MKILVFTKRYTSAKDLSKEGVGRPFRLFAALRDCGHEVDFLLGDYTERARRDAESEGFRFFIRPLSPAHLLSFRGVVEKTLREGRYDLLIAEGDPLFALLAGRACRRRSVPLVYDLMDNYETYDIYRFPFVRALDRRRLRDADLVVCVTEALANKIRPVRRGRTCVVGNGVDLDSFRPMEREACRRRLGIPTGKRIAGYFGYMAGYKGINCLLKARHILEERGGAVTLLLAGKKAGGIALPENSIICRGLVPHSTIPEYINACDCAVVPNPSNAYTDYSFPLKITEAMACGVPVAATALGPVREILGEDYPWLARPGDAAALADAIEGACQRPLPGLRKRASEMSWKRQAQRLDRELVTLNLNYSSHVRGMNNSD